MQRRDVGKHPVASSSNNAQQLPKQETETDLQCWGLNRISCSEPAVCVLKTVELGPLEDDAAGRLCHEVGFCDMCTQRWFGSLGLWGNFGLGVWGPNLPQIGIDFM
jgi:hypothetical protein